MLCVCVSVCEPTAPSMSHFKVLSLSASWHLLTPTIIMLIYIVWLHKVIYAQFYSVAAQGCVPLLLNGVKKNISWSSDSFYGLFFFESVLPSLTFGTHPPMSIKSLKALTNISRATPTEKIIAKFTNWTTLICSWRDNELRSLCSQSLLAPYRKW